MECYSEGFEMNAEEIKQAMEERRGVYPEQVTRSDLSNAGCSELVCLLPKDFNERISYLGNTLTQMLTRSPKDDKLRSTVGQLCQSLSYMLNSCSWQEGELLDFDAEELSRKLSRLVKR